MHMITLQMTEEHFGHKQEQDAWVSSARINNPWPVDQSGALTGIHVVTQFQIVLTQFRELTS